MVDSMPLESVALERGLEFENCERRGHLDSERRVSLSAVLLGG